MDAGVLFGAVRTRVDRGGLLHGEADRGWRLELSGLAVDPAVAESAKSGLLTGRPGRLGVARNADFFPHDGRQAIPGNSAPKALDTHHLLASPALWWVTTAVVALTIAVFALHRHLRSRHLRSRVRYDLLPTATFEPSIAGVVGFAHQLGRARPVHGWVPKSAVAVRIRFSTDDRYGKMVMSVEGRRAITSVINKLVYPDVEIRRSAAAAESGRGGPAPVTRGEASSEADRSDGRNVLGQGKSAAGSRGRVR